MSNDSFGLSSKEGDKDSPPPVKPGKKQFGSPAANQQRFDNTVFLSGEPLSANVTDQIHMMDSKGINSSSNLLKLKNQTNTGSGLTGTAPRPLCRLHTMKQKPSNEFEGLK